MNTHVYIVSSPRHMEQSEYKIGKFFGTEKKLRTRYNTYFINTEVIRFFKCEDYDKMEKDILSAVKEYRIDKTEWVKMDINKLLDIFDFLTKWDHRIFHNRKNMGHYVDDICIICHKSCYEGNEGNGRYHYLQGSFKDEIGGDETIDCLPICDKCFKSEKHDSECSIILFGREFFIECCNREND